LINDFYVDAGNELLKGRFVMKKIVLLVLCVALAVVMLTGCITVVSPHGWRSRVHGRGAPELHTFTTGEITEVRVELLCDILYSSAPSDSVTLEIQPNLMKYVVVEESGGVLTVRSTRNIHWSGHTSTPVLRVSTPSLSRVSHTGAGTFKTLDPINADSFSLNITGAANSKAELNVDSLSVRLTGAGDIELFGRADVAKIDIAGAGKLDALDLLTRSTHINFSGVSTVRVNCSDNLCVVGGGVGSVEYTGSPVIDISRGGLITLKSV